MNLGKLDEAVAEVEANYKVTLVVQEIYNEYINSHRLALRELVDEYHGVHRGAPTFRDCHFPGCKRTARILPEDEA